MPMSDAEDERRHAAQEEAPEQPLQADGGIGQEFARARDGEERAGDAARRREEAHIDEVKLRRHFPGEHQAQGRGDAEEAVAPPAGEPLPLADIFDGGDPRLDRSSAAMTLMAPTLRLHHSPVARRRSIAAGIGRLFPRRARPYSLDISGKLGRWTPTSLGTGSIPPRSMPELLRIVKAASLVEQNGGDYARYLCNVFADDPRIPSGGAALGRRRDPAWQALGRWAELADPGFDHEAACGALHRGISRAARCAEPRCAARASGELIARCIVETGTSSYYTALAEAAAEPVLKEICRRIAADEIRHYKLFYTHMTRYLAAERLGLWGRLRVALGRVAESEDDELAYAYYAANDDAGAYDRRRCSRAYARRAYAVYRRHHVERGIAMLFKAVGLKPQGRLKLVAARLAWWGMRRRVQRLDRIAA